jgi:hypothetical protein
MFKAPMGEFVCSTKAYVLQEKKGEEMNEERRQVGLLHKNFSGGLFYNCRVLQLIILIHSNNEGFINYCGLG